MGDISPGPAPNSSGPTALSRTSALLADSLTTDWRQALSANTQQGSRLPRAQTYSAAYLRSVAHLLREEQTNITQTIQGFNIQQAADVRSHSLHGAATNAGNRSAERSIADWNATQGQSLRDELNPEEAQREACEAKLEVLQLKHEDEVTKRIELEERLQSMELQYQTIKSALALQNTNQEETKRRVDQHAEEIDGVSKTVETFAYLGQSLQDQVELHRIVIIDALQEEAGAAEDNNEHSMTRGPTALANGSSEDPGAQTTTRTRWRLAEHERRLSSMEQTVSSAEQDISSAEQNIHDINEVLQRLEPHYKNFVNGLGPRFRDLQEYFWVICKRLRRLETATRQAGLLPPGHGVVQDPDYEDYEPEYFEQNNLEENSPLVIGMH